MSNYKKTRRFFIDTNIFVYCFDSSHAEKRLKARELVQECLDSGRGFISWQVVQEFANAASTKFRNAMNKNDLQDFITRVMIPLCDVYPGPDTYIKTLEIQSITGYSFYDSLILQAAIQANCDVFYSEDMQHGRMIMDLEIRNPFIDKPLD